MASRIPCIYIISNTRNGKVYVGQTIHLKRRWATHRRLLNSGKHFNLHLQAAWDKYKPNSFKFLILEYCEVSELDEREQHHLSIYFNKGLCYNLSNSVKTPTRGVSPSEETRLKLRLANLGKKASEETKKKLSEQRKGENNGKGYKHTEEAKRKMSEALKGNKRTLGHKASEETKRKQSEVRIGKKASEKTKANMRVAQQNRPPIREETRKKLSDACKNRSEETKQKIKNGLKGNKNSLGRECTPEMRKKISDSLKRRAAEQRQYVQKLHTLEAASVGIAAISDEEKETK